ncbi:hypothetical protein [Jeotgalibacillus marinus]|uniref:Uncharacterized protein n=1 Tax=Jeotgalibacillus marinus TaxID=86667 RepID=A0ABV3Q554_9BACL
MSHKKKKRSKRNCLFISIFNLVNCGSCDKRKHDHKDIVEAALENTDIKDLLEAAEAAEDDE